MFCLFAKDVGLLPERLFGALLEAVRGRPAVFADRARELFAAMRSGGWFGLREIPWFNGGLFDDTDALPLEGLVHAHQALDATVAAAYGWPVELGDEEILRRLLALNRARTAATAAHRAGFV